MSLILDPSGNLNYFVEEIKARALNVSPMTHIYLAGLMMRMIKAENLFVTVQDGTLIDKPFCIQLYETAQEPSNHQRGLLYQRAGDAILFYSGYFRPKLVRRGLSLSYFSGLGRQAYQQSAILAPSKKLVFTEIANEFESISDGISGFRKK